MQITFSRSIESVSFGCTTTLEASAADTTSSMTYCVQSLNVFRNNWSVNQCSLNFQLT